MEGWVSIYRILASSDLWLKQKFTKGQAWVDLILLANHTDGIIEKRGSQIPIKRGQLGWSELALSCRWKWSRNKTTRFLKWLESEEQIIQQRSKVTTLITVLNYNRYQSTNHKTIQQTIQQKNNRTKKTIQQKDTNNNDNNINNDNKKNIYAPKVSLTPEEFKKLIEQLGEEQTKNYITDLSLYKQSKGKKYKSDYATILTWNRKDIKEGKNRGGNRGGKINYAKLLAKAKACFKEHNRQCDNPNYTVSGNMLEICKICKDNKGSW